MKGNNEIVALIIVLGIFFLIISKVLPFQIQEIELRNNFCESMGHTKYTDIKFYKLNPNDLKEIIKIECDNSYVYEINYAHYCKQDKWDSCSEKIKYYYEVGK